MIDKVKDIVKRASGLMVREGFDVKEKDGFVNIVTSSDIAVEQFLKKELAELLPGCGFICEEEDVHDSSHEYVWIVDPIDGTANYARGDENCCISVALMKAGEVILGVVYSPWRGEMYEAQKGCGARLNGRPIHVSDRPFEDSTFICALCLYRKEFGDLCSEVIMDVYHQANDVRRYGSAAVEECLLAAGRYDLYFEMRIQPWDYAAAAHIFTEAGGVITRLDGGPLGYDRPHLVVGANTPENHARLLQIVQSHIPQRPFND